MLGPAAILDDSKPSTDGRTWLFWTAVAIGFSFFVFFSGRHRPHYVPDSASYINYPLNSLPDALRSIRTPGYPLFIALPRSITGNEVLVPLSHIILIAFSCFLLSRELTQLSISTWPNRFAVLSVALGCTVMDHINTVATDAPAMACGLIAITQLIAWARTQQSLRYGITLLISALLTISMRPAYLFLIPWIGFTGFVLLRMYDTKPWRALCLSGCLMLSVSLPVLAWCTLRYSVVKDFGIAPFGGQNLAGVLVQLVSDDELRELQGPSPAIIEAIIEQKALVSNDRSWFLGDPSAYMTWEERWHDVSWRIVVPAVSDIVGKDPIANHRAIQTMNRAVLTRYPLRYAMWYAKAIRRGCWVAAADMVMHPFFLATLLATVGFFVFTATKKQAWPPIPLGPGIQVITVVATTYFLFKIAFVSLSSPPIGRFTDAGAFLIPACFIIPLLQWPLLNSKRS